MSGLGERGVGYSQGEGGGEEGNWTFAENIIGTAPMTLSVKLCSGVAGPAAFH